MKKIILLVVVLFLGLGGSACAKSGRVSKNADPFAGWNKLDAQAKQLWRENVDKSMRWLNVIIQTDEPVKKVQKKQLKSVGFKYRSVVPSGTGSIVTGKIENGGIAQLAGLEFVKYIEAAKVVSPKGAK